DGRFGRDVPAVETGAPHPFVTVRRETAVHVEVHREVFDQNEPRPPACEIESLERLDLMSLDVDREEIDRRGRTRLDEDVIERPHGNVDAASGAGGRNVEVRVEG